MYNRARIYLTGEMTMAEKIILTGDRPTGKLHVGHYVGSLKRRVELQNSGTFDKIFIMIADARLPFGRNRSGEVSYFYPVLRDGADGADILLPESGYGLQIAAQPDG